MTLLALKEVVFDGFFRPIYDRHCSHVTPIEFRHVQDVFAVVSMSLVLDALDAHAAVHHWV